MNDRTLEARRAIAALALSCLLAGCAELATTTQVILWVDASPSIRREISTVAVTVESNGVIRLRRVDDFRAATPPKLVLGPRGDDADRRYRVRAEARAKDGTALATLELRSGYVAGEARYARLVFEAACRAASIEREPRQLGRSREDAPELRGCAREAPPAADGGADAGLDAPNHEPNATATAAADASPADASPTEGAVPDGPSDACGAANRPCACSDGSVPFDEGCRAPTACDRQTSCAEACQLEGESYRCICNPGGIPRNGADGRCWHWQPRQRVDESTGNVRRAALAMNPAGTAVAIWFEQICPLPGCGSEVETRLWANRYDPAIGWREPLLVLTRAESDIAGFAPSQGAPAVALDDAGNALVLWEEAETPDTRALQAALLPAESWSTAIELESPGPIIVRGGLLQRDPTGGFYVASTSGAASESFGWWIRRFTRADGWQPRIELSRPVDALAALAFEVGANGQLTLLWKHASGQIQTARLDPAAPSSSVRMPIEGSARAHGGLDLDVAVNARGDALAVWLQANADDTASELYWSEAFGEARWWWEARRRSGRVGYLTYPRTTFDGSERGTIAWIEAEGESQRVYAVSAQREPRLIDQPDTGVSSEVQLAGDRLGHTVAIWSRTQAGRNALWANRLDDAGWNGPIQLERDADLVVRPQLALSAEGDALVLWQGQDEGGRNVLYSRAFR